MALDYSALENLHFKEVFIGQGIDELLEAIHTLEDYTLILFEGTTHRKIWVSDDSKAGHSVFVLDTVGKNKDKMLLVDNSSQKSLFLWHIDGVMFGKMNLSKCDCALLHDKQLHFIEFKTDALNSSESSIKQHYDKACDQLSGTFKQVKQLYEEHGLSIWSVFEDVTAQAVFDKSVPHDNAYQKSKKKAFLEENHILLTFDNVMKIE